MKYSKSQSLIKKYNEITPLFSQTYSKSLRYFPDKTGPIFVSHAKGNKIIDVDGNEFVDFVCALGAVTIGYNHFIINRTIKKQLKKGIIYSTQSPSELILSKKLTEIIPGCESVRFVKNGSDATSSAVRLARAYTGKDIILKCGYHGMDDWSIGTSINNKGVPHEVSKLTINFEYNNLTSLKKLFKEYKNEVAAVIIEPIQGNGPVDDYLKELKTITHSNNAILIFDEVVSGFRYKLGGASELYEVTPDLAAYGKGIANGMPLSVIIGRKDIMNLIKDGVFVSTTFGGETLSINAALSTIDIMEKKDYSNKIWNLGTKMLEGLKTQIDTYKLHDVVELYGLAPKSGIIFKSYKDWNDLQFQTYFQMRMLDFGILTYGINLYMLNHKQKDIINYLRASDVILGEIKGFIESNNLVFITNERLINPIFNRNKTN